MPTHKFGLWAGPRSITPTELHPGDKVFLDETDVWICRMAGGNKLTIPVNVYWNGGEGTELRPRNKLIGARARDRFPEIAGEIGLAHNLRIVPITIEPPPPSAYAFNDYGPVSHWGFPVRRPIQRRVPEVLPPRPHQVGFQFLPISA